MPGRDAALHGREFESKTPKRETRKLAVSDAPELVSPPRDFFLHKKNGPPARKAAGVGYLSLVAKS